VPRTFRPLTRSRAPLSLVDEQHRRSQQLRQRDGGGLARIECLLQGVFHTGAFRLIADDDPRRVAQRFDPHLVGARDDGLAPDRFGNDDLLIERAKQLELPDARQVKQRHGVRHHDHGPLASSLRKSSRS
jgi:hypothetical protein